MCVSEREREKYVQCPTQKTVYTFSVRTDPKYLYFQIRMLMRKFRIGIQHSPVKLKHTINFSVT